MSFSDDEPILIEEKSRLKTVVLITGIGLFVFSLFNICFCTANGCRGSMEAFLMGWLAMLAGGAAISWLANPCLIVAWILLMRNMKYSWLFAIAAAGFSLLFLHFHVVIENEAGHYNPILKTGLGYWFWLTSCLTTCIGSLILRVIKYKDE